MNDINQLKKDQSEKHPAFGSYLECMTRTLFTGLAAFTLTFSGTFLAQSLAKKVVPYGRNGYVLASTCLATAVSYHITSQRTKACQAAWMAAEDKHTYLTQGNSRCVCFRTLNLTLTKSPGRCFANGNPPREDNEEDTEAEYEDLVKRTFHLSDSGNQVLIVQPYVKWGAGKKRNTRPELQLAEAVALIETLPRWKVVDKLVLPLQSFHKTTFFGKGNLKMLRDKVRENERIVSVFISVNQLRGTQHHELEEQFGVPVFDRYMIVIQIFREHATTMEAKLQVARAEIPYLRSRIRDYHEGALERIGASTSAIGGALERIGASTSAIGGDGETFVDVRRKIVGLREKKLKQELEKIRSNRELLRSNRTKLQYATVAVVGYTNAGKTSLIKALTGKAALQPKDQLFATLDITVHEGCLPSRLKVLYVDTVGFISDIPTELIEAFNATLEDALLADVIVHVCDMSHPDLSAQCETDVIVHVCDMSHPDLSAQCETVTATLQRLNVDKNLLENVIVAGNKIDLPHRLGPDMTLPPDITRVSALHHTGLNALSSRIEKSVLAATGRVSMVIRVLAGSSEMAWLYKEVAVSEVVSDSEDSQYVLVRVVISEGQLGRFKRLFID
uniref:Hflx-type G domain-containing protein n=1 Tax=Timema bartmani TaxID=61472 RepID=A0A7R9F6J4_9NEOP|nr:unnamed protein product [Timema bartmani]